MILLLRIVHFSVGLDFSPLGTSMAAIDGDGVCVISDVATNDYSYHIDLKSGGI